MAGNEGGAVLHAGAALEERLEEIAEHAEQGDEHADDGARESVERHEVQHARAGDRPCNRRGGEPADRAFDGLGRTDGRRQLPPPERAPGVVLRRVADRDDEHQREDAPTDRP